MTSRELTGGLLEEAIYRFLWVAFNDQAFLWRPWFALSTLRFLFFGHLVLSYLFRQRVPVMVPQPGLEPGRPDWSRGCKPRSYANSDTGGQKPDVGTEGLSNRAVPAYFGPSSAALNLFSRFSRLSSPIFRVHAENSYDLHKQIAVTIGDIRRILNERIRQSWNGHALHSLRSVICFGMLLPYLVTFRLTFNAARCWCAIAIRAASRARFCFCNVRRNFYPALLHSLDKETYRFREHLSGWNTAIITKSLFQLSSSTALNIERANNRFVFFVQSRQEKLPELSWVSGYLHEFAVSGSSAAFAIHITKEFQTGHQSAVVCSGQLIENATIYCAGGNRRLRELIDCSLENTERTIGRGQSVLSHGQFSSLGECTLARLEGNGDVIRKK